MRQFSNRYMLLYSAALVSVVAVLLSVVAVALHPLQKQNVERERKQMILQSIGVESDRNDCESLYESHIKEMSTDNGEIYYQYEHDGKRGVVLPMRGTGLWGPIWAYMAFDETWTIVGAVFDHKGETPGLGGEISTPKFAQRFVGKRVVDIDGKVKPVVLSKHADKASPYEVDAISGGTMTSNGVSAMIAGDLDRYASIIEGGAHE